MLKMITSDKIESAKYTSDDFVLACPRCCDGNLHHTQVTIFSRLEDEVVATVTTVNNSNVSLARIDNEQTDNPSRRRDGLNIRFRCKNCGGEKENDIIELSLSQHKGSTFVQWIFSEKV